MGCVQGKPLSPKDGERAGGGGGGGGGGGLGKLKLQNGYIGAGYVHGRRPLLAKRDCLGLRQRAEAVEEGRAVTREGERGALMQERGVLTQRLSPKVVHGILDEVADGWPQWLVENVPREVLVGLVPKSAESYDKLDKIGQGTYSNVYKARDRVTRKIVALKKVRFDTSESESVRFMAREIMILQKLDHPNIIKLEGLATSRMPYSLYLVFDFMQSDLSRVISRPDQKLTEPQVKCYMQQLLSGLQHCHERGILHRDIKGSNLLVDKHGALKIADFGLANYFKPNQKDPLTSRVVTLWYRAPELLLGATDYGVGIDLWSAGCLLAEMFVGRPIMPGRNEVEQLHKIFKLCGSPSDDYWRKLKLSTSFRLHQPYKSNIIDAFKDFPASSLSLLTKLLALDPTERGTASTALQSDFFSTSPLACDLSGLPNFYKEEENERLQFSARKKHSISKAKRQSRMHRESRVKKIQVTNKNTTDSGSSREDKEKSAEPSLNHETGSSTGSTSSIVVPSTRDNTPPSLSPIALSHHKRPVSTEAHPRAFRNIKNMPPSSSTALVMNNAATGIGGNMVRSVSTSNLNTTATGSNMFKSASTTNFRPLEGNKLYSLNEK